MKLKYKNFSCPVCNNKKNIKVYPSNLKSNELPVIGYDYSDQNQDKTFAYVECINCHHVYASPRVIDMYKYYIDKVDHKYIKNSSFRRLTYSRVVNILSKFKKKGKILEIGSGMGDFIYSAEKKGYNCTGLELSIYASKFSKQLKQKIYNFELKNLSKEIGNKKFDIIVMMGVIEHLEFPLKELDIIKKYLNKDGLVVLWTGDYDSIYSKILGKKWWYVIGQHIQLFSRKSLRFLFEQKAFKLVHNGNLPYIFHYKYLDTHLSRFLIYKFFLRAFCYPIFKLLNIIEISLSSEILMIFKKKE
jgi:2-polyprenyl-3-methyl-5-hydroxy-6-metoxy-1,4-benzoquinol methylase